MPIVVQINNGEKRDYESLSEGVHQAVIADVIDEGVKETAWGPKQRFRVVFMSDEADSTGYTKTASIFLKTKPAEPGKPLTFHTKSNAYKDLVKILGKEVPNGFDLEQLIGIRKGLVIQHSEDKEGNIWANVTGYLKPQGKLRFQFPSRTPARRTDPPRASIRSRHSPTVHRAVRLAAGRQRQQSWHQRHSR
jgi:hypothetical protein